jgi:hypothetical protein
VEFSRNVSVLLMQRNITVHLAEVLKLRGAPPGALLVLKGSGSSFYEGHFERNIRAKIKYIFW